MKNKCNGVFVFKSPEESVDTLIKRFKKKVKNSKILQQYTDCGFYEKPSKVRREKNKQSKIRKQKFLEQLDN